MKRPERLFTSSFILLCLSNFTSFFSFYFFLATLPLYLVFIGGSQAETGLVLGVYAGTAVAIRPLVGPATDRWGRKALLVPGLAVFVVGAFLYRFTDSVPALLALRVFHGIGWGALGTAASVIVADIVPQDRRGEGMGYYGMAPNIAMVVSPALGITLMKAWGFSTLFTISGLIALFALLFALPIREPPRAPANPRSRSGILERSALFPSLVLALTAMTYSSLVSFFPIFATEKGMANPGLFFTAYAIILILVRGATGKLSDRYGRGVLTAVGLALIAVALAILANSSSLPHFLAAAFFYALGFASTQPALMALVVDRSPANSRGAALGTFTTAMDVGIGAGAFLWGAVSQVWGFPTMYLMAALVAVVALLAFALGYRRQAPLRPVGEGSS